MAGLYIHVPFCKSRCIYCDFYSTTCGENMRRRYVKAVCAELHMRKNETAGGTIDTIYIGGGTPSLLSGSELKRIFAAIASDYLLATDAEITIEANPDDVSPVWTDDVLRLGVNRVSLGVQTFDDALLQFLNRRHTARQARDAVRLLWEKGMTNLSIDLIYGLPGQTQDSWRRDLNEALGLPVRHISAYNLMFESGTRLTSLRNAGAIDEADESLIISMFQDLTEQMIESGFQQYEISNFALPGFHSRHNSSYWEGSPYIGCGPGAHSFDGHSVRRNNLADLAAYCAAPGMPPHATETLTEAERCDEMVFTALRTQKGLSLKKLEEKFGKEVRCDVLSMADPHIKGGRLRLKNDFLMLAPQGILVSDSIMSDLMLG